MKAVLFMAALASAGCLRTTSYKCGSNEQCGTGAVCESTGYCSFADTMCADGRRYGEYSGIYSNRCVGEDISGDSGVDSPGDGTMGDVPLGNCPTSYGITHNGHRYRVITAADQWTVQKGLCAADGTNKYLAIPDDQAELTAIVTAANAVSWVGVEDAAPDDQMMVSVKGAVFPTGTAVWMSGEPDDMPVSAGGAAECVAADTAMSGKLMDDRCSNQYVAVCECEP